MTVNKSMLNIMQELISMLPESIFKETIGNALLSKEASFIEIENIFKKMCSKKYPDAVMSKFLNGWKATHLKMLPIYGLSCRLDALAMGSKDEKEKLAYLESSAYNSSTSHEDLGIGFDAVTHAKLYDEFAYSLVGSDKWKLNNYDIKEANEFSQWVYKGMLLKPIPYALCINLISEFYNHAEYAYSYETFKYSMSEFYGLEGKELEDAIRYIDVHNEHETEIHHFLAVIESILKYEEASGEKITSELIEEVIDTYVASILKAFKAISNEF